MPYEIPELHQRSEKQSIWYRILSPKVFGTAAFTKFRYSGGVNKQFDHNKAHFNLH